jgi:hypothetical protein
MKCVCSVYMGVSVCVYVGVYGCECVSVCVCVSNNKADVSFVCSAWAARAGVPIAPADSVQLHKHH